ncbi:MAG TPA: hypothetical protein VF510_23680 [Ktedonobacterales bacterium]
MFGIWGVNNAWNGEPVSPEVLGRRTQLLSRRGPDNRGSYHDGSVGPRFAWLLRDHRKSRTDNGVPLFLLASLDLWFRVFIDNGSSVDPPPGSVEDLLEGEPARAAPDISAAL